MNVSVAPFAPPTPPDTGASIDSAPICAASACALRALSTSMVEESIHSDPALRGRSPQTPSTCRPAGSMVTTTSAAPAACAALSAIFTPSFAAASRDSATRSTPVTSCPALTRLAAIGPPMLPSPMKAIVDMGAFLLFDCAELASAPSCPAFPVNSEEKMSETPYQALSVETLPARLGAILADRIGPPGDWRVREVGDGNLNLVFIVEGPRGGVVVKQALPYVRLVGESWPLPLKRSFFEYHALTRQARRDPGRVPAVFHFDEAQALTVMEYLTPHKILRRDLEAGVKHEGLGEQLGLFLARTLFRGSDLSMKTAERKADVALFSDNVALCDITEQLVFTDPYYAAPMNRHTSPQLDGLVAELRADVDLKVAAQQLKLKFCNHAETLVHGDMHTGSIMAHGGDARVIDPEFAVYGPFGFDVGMLIANFLMAYFAQAGYERAAGERDEFRAWTLDVAEQVWTVFRAEFSRLWRSERAGILYPSALYEDQGHTLAAEQALAALLRDIWVDALGFAGVEIHRRILGLAHIAEFEHIEDPDARARCEARALRLGRWLAVNRSGILAFADIRATATRLEREAIG